ncbi:MAG: hypothetical protein ACXWWD_08900, partial [Chitinophagaceae bacterium]
MKEDLLILKKNWKYLRLYDCDEHGETVLEVIQNEELDFKVMMGAYIEAEMNNFGCPWGGGVFSEEQLKLNQENNLKKIQKPLREGKQIIIAPVLDVKRNEVYFSFYKMEESSLGNSKDGHSEFNVHALSNISIQNKNYFINKFSG